MENPHAGHRQRLRERFLKTGFDGFQPHEILELLLFYARPRIDTNEIAHALIDTFGSFSAVLDARVEDLAKVKGLGENGAVLLKMLPQLIQAYSLDSMNNETLDTSQKVCAYFLHSFCGAKKEQVRVACLDDQLHVVASEIIGEGGVSSVPMDMRKIVEFTYRSGCEMIIIAHNHPAGEAVPSETDIAVNSQLKTILKSVGIKLLDHIIVGNSRAVSMYDAGYFTTFN